MFSFYHTLFCSLLKLSLPSEVQHPPKKIFDRTDYFSSTGAPSVAGQKSRVIHDISTRTVAKYSVIPVVGTGEANEATLEVCTISSSGVGSDDEDTTEPGLYMVSCHVFTDGPRVGAADLGAHLLHSHVGRTVSFVGAVGAVPCDESINTPWGSIVGSCSGTFLAAVLFLRGSKSGSTSCGSNISGRNERIYDLFVVDLVAVLQLGTVGNINSTAPTSSNSILLRKEDLELEPNRSVVFMQSTLVDSIEISRAVTSAPPAHMFCSASNSSLSDGIRDLKIVVLLQSGSLYVIPLVTSEPRFLSHACFNLSANSRVLCAGLASYSYKGDFPSEGTSRNRSLDITILHMLPSMGPNVIISKITIDI